MARENRTGERTEWQREGAQNNLEVKEAGVARAWRKREAQEEIGRVDRAWLWQGLVGPVKDMTLVFILEFGKAIPRVLSKLGT